jgi:hypothetical protein
LPAKLPCLDTAPYTPLAERIFRGEIVFYLGAGACLNRLPLANEFYPRLAAKFDASLKGLSNPQIAQHFVDVYRRDDLYAQVDQFLGKVHPAPTVVHRLLATIPARLREKGFRPPPLVIFTTNYDDWMERALQDAGEPYHLFLYRAGDPYHGAFIHFDPRGGVRVIDNPAAFHRLPEDHTIVVKYHGGQAPLSHPTLPISYLFTERDFIELAGAVPGAIPKALIRRLQQSSLLFLGHSLRDGSTEALVRAAHKDRCAKMSWAVQWSQPEAGRPIPGQAFWEPVRRYWKAVGVELIVCPLERFVPELSQRIEEHPKADGKVATLIT